MIVRIVRRLLIAIAFAALWTEDQLRKLNRPTSEGSNVERTKVIEFLRKNWKWIIALIFATGGGFQFGRIHVQKGEKLEVYIIIPEDFPDIFGAPPAQAGAGEKVSDYAKSALRRAASVEREGMKLRDTEDGRKLFAVLQRLHNDPLCLPDIEEAVKTTQLDPLTLSLIAKIALKIAIVYLERRAPRTESEWDDRLLALLKLFADRPETINAAHAAIIRRGP